MSEYFVIVESPTKAKTIRKFLPKNFTVAASMGHIRDLPQTAADIPQKLKGESWARVGVNVDNNFEPLYVNVKGKSKTITELRQKMKKAKVLYLATDEDREGESISWHLIQVLKPKIPVKRMVFHEITKSAIEKAIKDCRDIDERLVRAQETRRILDRLVGFTLSPLIWKKIAYGLSAGRVQSAGLRLLVERERERAKFIKADYWDLKGKFSKDKKSFEAKLISLDGTPISSGKDFDPQTGKLKDPKKTKRVDEALAKKLTEDLKKANFEVASVEEKEFNSKPVPPFITSTLQQEANRKLGLTARNAMRIAQSLYEQGLITYMRTDSPNLSQEAIKGARKAVETLYGKDYLSAEPRQYSSKSKSAQEAHEAIRPAGEKFLHPKETGLSGKDLQLYELIWKRTVATQMKEARKSSVRALLTANGATFSANGRRILFPGFLRAYVEGHDDPGASLEDQEVHLPELKKGDSLKPEEMEPEVHETKPIARFTEASLVQRLEEEGIGRPSTYAAIISTIIDRGYTKKNGNSLTPTFTGFAVVQLLERHFDHLVDYSFTSQMEKDLDEIASGDRKWLPYLKDFYLGKSGLQQMVQAKEKKIDANQSRVIDLLEVDGVEIRVGRFGPYLVTQDDEGEEVRASIPEDISPANLDKEKLNEIVEASLKGPQSIGKHPDSGQDIYVLLGRYGPYVQLGEVTEEVPKPRRASVPKDLDYQNLALADAVKLLSLPRELGNHPESGKVIIANRGRFGPYIAHDDDFRSLKTDDVFTVTLERALEILAEEKRTRRSKVLKDLGTHPKTEKKITLNDGKFGPYLKVASKNIGIPKDFELDVEKFELKDALKIIDGDAPTKEKAAAPKKSTRRKKPDPKTKNVRRAKKRKKRTASGSASRSREAS